MNGVGDTESRIGILRGEGQLEVVRGGGFNLFKGEKLSGDSDPVYGLLFLSSYVLGLTVSPTVVIASILKDKS